MLLYQYQQPQGKLVSVLTGRIFDVAVDIRPGSASFGRWAGAELSAENHRQMYIPEGFAHGFVVTSEEPANVLYKVDQIYDPAKEGGIRWNDPEFAIEWPIDPIEISDKDRTHPDFDPAHQRFRQRDDGE